MRRKKKEKILKRNTTNSTQHFVFVLAVSLCLPACLLRIFTAPPPPPPPLNRAYYYLPVLPPNYSTNTRHHLMKAHKPNISYNLSLSPANLQTRFILQVSPSLLARTNIFIFFSSNSNIIKTGKKYQASVSASAPGSPISAWRMLDPEVPGTSPKTEPTPHHSCPPASQSSCL